MRSNRREREVTFHTEEAECEKGPQDGKKPSLSTGPEENPVIREQVHRRGVNRKGSGGGRQRPSEKDPQLPGDGIP